MPFFEDGDVRIHYQEYGEGFPVLLIAPGGMRSSRQAWARHPWSPVEGLRDRYRVIAMDQRNAGESTAPVSADDGWAPYTEDQLALMDHLGIERFAVVGMCIGGPYIVRLCRAVPQRVAVAVMFQPIGEQGNRDAFFALFDGWAEEIRAQHPEADAAAWASFRERMFGGTFMFGASREDVAACETPLLVLMGDDLYHPAGTSRAVAELAPNATLVERWKRDDERDAAIAEVRSFLEQHTAAREGLR